MKKTLVALAVLAATGSSFAQVTLSGTVSSGYKDQISADGAQSRTTGFGVDTATINFTAKEDIGGGQTIEAQMGLANVSRGAVAGTSLEPESTAFGPGDLTLTYTNTSVGRIQMGTTRGGAVNTGIPTAGAPVVDMDGKLFQLRSSSDFISYAVPIGPVVAIYKYSEAKSGLGAGTSGTAGNGATQMGQRTSDLALYLKQDGLELLGAYRTYDNRDALSLTAGNGLTKDTAIVLQAGYDFGVAKVGMGYNTIAASAGPKVVDMMIGVSAPMGALTVGATLGREVVSGVSDTPSTYFESLSVPAGIRTSTGLAFKGALALADGSANSMSLGAKYDLSKRTSLTANYARWTRSGYAQFEASGATGITNGITAAATSVGTASVVAAVTAFAPAPAALAAAQAAAGLAGATPTTVITAGAGAAGGAALVGAASVAAANAVTAASTIANATAAAATASKMGYQADGSEFNILLTYSF